MEDIQQETAPKRRVKYGTRPNDSVPHEWAETMFMEWRKREPHHFGRYLQYAALGEFPTTGRPRANRHDGEAS